MSVRLVFLIALLAAGIVFLFLRRRREDPHPWPFAGEARKALPEPSTASAQRNVPPSAPTTGDDVPSPQERETADDQVAHVAEVLDRDLMDGNRTSSVPPIPLLTPRFSEPSSGVQHRTGKAVLPPDAGRYSFSPHSRRTTPPDPVHPVIPKAPRVPHMAPSPEGVAAPESDGSSSPSSEPRTQRGLGVPTPPPERSRSSKDSGWRGSTVSGLGSFGRHRDPRASTTPPAGRPTEEAPSSPKPNQGATATSLVVQRIRPSSLPPPRWHDALGPACDDLVRRTARAPRIVLLTAPERSSASLAEVAVELAARLAKVVSGGVALVETDFERPRLRQLFGFEVPFGMGLSEQLHAHVRGRGSAPWRVLDAELGFHLVVEGRIRSPGLLWSQGFPEIVHALARKYRLVLLVAPSPLTSVDRQALDDVCDEVIVVSG